MKIIFRSKAVYLLVSLVFVMTFALQACTENNKLVEGPKTTKVIFDFRDSVLESALIHIKLIHDTYKDKNIVTDKPEFAVVFMGGSVNLLSKSRDGYSPEDQKILEKIGEIITAMSKDGIRLEVCMFAANLFGLDPDSILPEIHQIKNGWISSIRYQEKGYVLVPVF
ncbi:MAG: DsrE family protein [Pseudomonadota bacterium]